MSRKKQKDQDKSLPQNGVQVEVKKPSRLSAGRITLICAICAVMLGLFISALITYFRPDLQHKYGEWLTMAARTIDAGFSPNLADVYGRWLCLGYFGVISIGFLAISSLLRYDRRRLSTLFKALFIVTAIAADVAAVLLCRGQIEGVTAEQAGDTAGVYKLLGFIPLPTLAIFPLLMIVRIYAYVGMPIIAQILMLGATAGLRRFKPRLYELLMVLLFILLMGFIPVLICYLFYTVFAVLLIGGLLWGLKGFFTIDTGRYVQTSDGSSLYQVDGDLYSDGNGNYYTYDGDSFH